ncbi:Na+/glutamate symporter [Thermocatellispora tengchongensis]|uniref:Na+/glutamate symporter n=1 Tax=Thermocatellispora tengchongensis TaxID=1073253 RepID=A0A840PDQ8_9ACTN|nr:hypothetical protein [Thermocatellispora tengchongensis]MBB5135570.1 Na+/glutamate symporter [Thermocatellispora tengchongensis]
MEVHRGMAKAITVGAVVGVLTGLPSAAWTLAQTSADAPRTTSEHDRMMGVCHAIMDTREHTTGYGPAE